MPIPPRLSSAHLSRKAKAQKRDPKGRFAEEAKADDLADKHSLSVGLPDHMSLKAVRQSLEHSFEAICKQGSEGCHNAQEYEDAFDWAEELENRYCNYQDALQRSNGLVGLFRNDLRNPEFEIEELPLSEAATNLESFVRQEYDGKVPSMSEMLTTLDNTYSVGPNSSITAHGATISDITRAMNKDGYTADTCGDEQPASELRAEYRTDLMAAMYAYGSDNTTGRSKAYTYISAKHDSFIDACDEVEYQYHAAQENLHKQTSQIINDSSPDSLLDFAASVDKAHISNHTKSGVVSPAMKYLHQTLMEAG